MEFKDYFQYVTSVLHEAQPAAPEVNTNMNPIEPGIDQGAGIEDPALNMAPDVITQDPVMAGEVDPEMAGVDDAAYMNMEPQEPTIDDITQRQQKTKLFDNFSELLKLADYARESFDQRISLDLLSRKQYDVIQFGVSKFENIIQKIKDYQLNSFLVREYEESLYTYMLLRSELLTTISFVRKSLHLSRITKEDEKSSEGTLKA